MRSEFWLMTCYYFVALLQDFATDFWSLRRWSLFTWRVVHLAEAISCTYVGAHGFFTFRKCAK